MEKPGNLQSISYPRWCAKKPQDFTRLSQDIENTKLAKIEFTPLSFTSKVKTRIPDDS